jgi:hypothetical protein
MSTATVGRGEGYRSRCILPHITVGARSRGCSSSLPHAGGRCTASSGMAVEKRRRRPAHLPGGHRLPRKEQEAQAAVRRWEAASELGETGHRRKARERSSRRGGVRLQHCRSFVSSLRGSRGKRRGGGATDETKQGYDGAVGPAGDAARREKGQKTQECSTPPAFAHSTEPDAATTRGAQYAFLQIADAVLDAVAAGVGLRGQKQPDLPCLPSLCSSPPSRALGAMRGGLLRDATTRDCT